MAFTWPRAVSQPIWHAFIGLWFYCCLQLCYTLSEMARTGLGWDSHFWWRNDLAAKFPLYNFVTAPETLDALMHCYCGSRRHGMVLATGPSKSTGMSLKTSVAILMVWSMSASVCTMETNASCTIRHVHRISAPWCTRPHHRQCRV